MSICQALDICIRDQRSQCSPQTSHISDVIQCFVDNLPIRVSMEHLLFSSRRIHTSSRPDKPSNEIRSCLRNVLCKIAAAILIPLTIPTLLAKKSPELATAI